MQYTLASISLFMLVKIRMMDDRYVCDCREVTVPKMDARPTKSQKTLPFWQMAGSFDSYLAGRPAATCHLVMGLIFQKCDRNKMVAILQTVFLNVIRGKKISVLLSKFH